MNILARYQNYILMGVVLIAAFGIYTYYFTGDEEPVLKQETATGLSNPIDQELIALLFQLKGISLDESLFANPVFLSLQDYGQTLVAEPVGRINPFAPYGQGAP